MIGLFKRQKSQGSEVADQDLFLHIGVHKTASTHFQGTFKLNLPEIEKAGLYYLPLKQFREEFTHPCIHQKSGASDRGAKFFDTVFENRRAAFLSDENIIGVLDTLLTGEFYPRMSRNLKRLRAMLGRGRNLKIFCCIRNYAPWVESAYLQTLKRKVTPFDSFVNKLNPNKLSWPRLIDQIAEVTASPITLWTYEAYCSNNEAILNEIGQTLGVSLPKRLDSRPNPSLSGLAVELLLKAEKEIRKGDRQKLFKFLRLNLSTNHGYPKPDLLPAALRSQLSANYEKDLKILQSNPKVKILSIPQSS